MSKFLKTQKTKIIGPNGKPIFLRGVNVGGWLMMEAYIMHAPNFPEHQFRKNFIQTLGLSAMQDFDKSFREAFITQKDFKNIADMGCNCVRVPFHYRLIEEEPYQIRSSGIKILDKVLQWAQKYKIYVILDMHAVPGAQNEDWHSDSTGKAQFWTKKDHRDRALHLWQYVANRYKNKEYLAGYDLLNETVLPDAKALNAYYQECIQTIRSVDKNHILFIEGNRWATDIACLDNFDDENYCLSIHTYEPMDFTFNYVPHLNYPSLKKNRVYNAMTMRKHLEQYHRVAQERQKPVFVGEFGVNTRAGLHGEEKCLEDHLILFREYDFHWTYWTYKAVKNATHPDGIYSYKENPAWVNRGGPLMGWQTYHLHWESSKRDMIQSWDTDQFQENIHIYDTLKKYV